MKKNRLLEQLEDVGLVDKNLSGAAKHSWLKGLLHPISIAGGLDNPLVEVEYKGRQSNVILTTQGESTLKIFGVKITIVTLLDFLFSFFYRTSSAMFDLEYDRQLLFYFNGNGALSFDVVMNPPG
jgi:hypothetical protein